jgi:hypothetical protein
MKLPDIDMDLVAIAAVIVTFMFCSMRLLYGYWPWQLHPKLKRQREKVIEELVGFNFEPVAQDTNDSSERPATGGEPVITTPPRGPTRTQELQ